MTLAQIKKQFKTNGACIEHLEQVLWGNIPRCPYCQAKKPSPMPNEQRYHCNNCHASFSVTVHTPFHRTRLDLRKWFLAIHYYINFPKLSLREFAKAVGVTKDTAHLIKQKLSIVSNELLQQIIKFK